MLFCHVFSNCRVSLCGYLRRSHSLDRFIVNTSAKKMGTLLTTSLQRRNFPTKSFLIARYTNKRTQFSANSETFKALLLRSSFNTFHKFLHHIKHQSPSFAKTKRSFPTSERNITYEHKTESKTNPHRYMKIKNIFSFSPSNMKQ